MKNCSLFSIFRRFGRRGQALNAKPAQKHQDWCPKTGVAPLGCRHGLYNQEPGAVHGCETPCRQMGESLPRFGGPRRFAHNILWHEGDVRIR
jgi:hypothetical protein